MHKAQNRWSEIGEKNNPSSIHTFFEEHTCMLCWSWHCISSPISRSKVENQYKHISVLQVKNYFEDYFALYHIISTQNHKLWVHMTEAVLFSTNNRYFEDCCAREILRIYHQIVPLATNLKIDLTTASSNWIKLTSDRFISGFISLSVILEYL